MMERKLANNHYGNEQRQTKTGEFLVDGEPMKKKKNKTLDSPSSEDKYYTEILQVALNEIAKGIKSLALT